MRFSELKLILSHAAPETRKQEYIFNNLCLRFLDLQQMDKSFQQKQSRHVLQEFPATIKKSYLTWNKGSGLENCHLGM